MPQSLPQRSTIKSTPMNDERADNSRRGFLELAFVFARRDGIARELNLSGGQVLVAMVTGICLAEPLVWGVAKYWLFAP